jgi:peptidoglycan hydrolase-like protein with peptidoglycan-binding domain
MAFWQKVNEKAQEVLKRGDSGDQVKDLQTKLNQNGANLEVDGVFGPQTEAEVKKLQQNNGLTVDGKVGPETRGFWDKTISAAKETLASKNNASGTSTAPKEFTYEDFTYNDYKESPVVSQAMAALEQQLAAKPGAYQSTWQGQINGIIDRIMNREDFSYDVNSDALYQQYKDQYSALGKLAMQDTMGQAAGLTGGYGSSYASTAGNQAYQSYLSQLNDVVPELYGMARDQYNQEGQEMYNQYGLLVDQENQDYGRYVDQYDQWASERNHLQGVYSDERNFDYGKYADDKSYAYNEYRNAISDEQWEKNYKLNEEAWELEKQAYTDSTKTYAGTTPGGASYNNGGLTNGQVKELQAALGVEADGYYGEKSKEAAKGLSAAEAYAKYVGTTASETGGTAEERKYYKEMPWADIIDTIEGYLTPDKDGSTNEFAAKGFIDDLYMAERITPEEWQAFMDQYFPKTKDDKVDVTVDPNGANGTGGSHIVDFFTNLFKN